MAKMPGFDAMQRQQEAFVKAMTGGIGNTWPGSTAPMDENDGSSGKASAENGDLDDIKKQLAELQHKLSKLKK
jgi:hypothetical protein